jgi:hypothetical protein
VNLLGGGHVGGGDGVVADLRDAELAGHGFPYGDGEDGATGIGFGGRGDGGEVGGEADAVKAAGEDFGVGDGAVGAMGVCHAVQGEGDGVEVALGDDAGGVDEVLEVRCAGNGGLVEVGGGADGFQVEEDDGVGLGEQAGGLRRCLGAKVEHETEGGEDGEGDEERDGCAFAHGGQSGLGRRR